MTATTTGKPKTSKAKKIVKAAAKVAAPIATAAVISKMTTGKFDLKNAVLSAVDALLAKLRAPKASQ